MGISFRHSAGFGKRMEYNLAGKDACDVSALKEAGRIERVGGKRYGHWEILG